MGGSAKVGTGLGADGEFDAGRLGAWADLYVSVLVVYEVNNLLAGVDMTERVTGAWMHEKMD
jgi:hypothetical protein